MLRDNFVIIGGFCPSVRECGHLRTRLDKRSPSVIARRNDVAIPIYTGQIYKVRGYLTPAVLQYMKNEIYASYLYKFKNKAWNDVFEGRFYGVDDKKNTSVDDSLTIIDKYNISWLNQKLQGQKSNTLAAE